MRCGNSTWPKEQDRRSFLLCKAVEYLVCNFTHYYRKISINEEEYYGTEDYTESMV